MHKIDTIEYLSTIYNTWLHIAEKFVLKTF